MIACSKKFPFFVQALCRTFIFKPFTLAAIKFYLVNDHDYFVNCFKRNIQIFAQMQVVKSLCCAATKQDNLII